MVGVSARTERRTRKQSTGTTTNAKAKLQQNDKARNYSQLYHVCEDER